MKVLLDRHRVHVVYVTSLRLAAAGDRSLQLPIRLRAADGRFIGIKFYTSSYRRHSPVRRA
jgi:hypothetical protein